MKHTILYIASILLCASCGQEEFAPEQTLGYLSLSEVSLEASHVQLISTRADEDEPLIVELLQGKEVKYSKIYTDGMTLSCAPGSYTLQIRSESYGTDESAAKYYYSHGPVEVKEGEIKPDFVERMKKILPAYAVPRRYAAIGKFKETNSGKVIRSI